MRGATPAQIRLETGLKHHPTFNELIDQYKEGGPKIPWNDDPELILRSPAIASLSGMAAAADDRIRDQMALDRRNYYIREEARKQGLDFHTVRGFMDTVAPWADHNKPMDDDEWNNLDDDMDTSSQDMPPPPPPPKGNSKGPQQFDIFTPRGGPPPNGTNNQAPPRPPPPPPRGTGFAAPGYSGMDASYNDSARSPKEPSQASSSSSGSGGPPPATPGRGAQARGEDGLFHLHLQHQTAQMERHHAATSRWLEHLLNQVQQMGRKHDEQNRAMQALHSKQNTMEDLLARRMSETRQAAEQAEQQRAQMTDARFQQMLGQIERLATHHSQQQQSVEIMRLLQGYLSEHLYRTHTNSAQMQSETLNALSQKLGEVENALRGMGQQVSESTQGALHQLHQALREHKTDMREGISAGLQQQEQARQAFNKDAMEAFTAIQRNLSGLGAQTSQMIQETQTGIAATQAGMETLNSQQTQQAAMMTALGQMQQQGQAQQQELRTALGRLGERQQQILHGLLYSFTNPQMIQMTHQNQLHVFQTHLGVSNLNQVQREILLAMAGNKPVKPESLNYLLNQLDNSETSHLIKLAAQTQQAQLAIEDLPLPGAAAASSSQTPAPIAPQGLTPRLPDGSSEKTNELRPTNSVGLRQASPAPETPPPPPSWYPKPIKGLERPSVSLSREIARHTVAALTRDISLSRAKVRALQARSDAIVTRQVSRERSRSKQPEEVLANSTPKPPDDDNAPMGVRITRKQKQPDEIGVLANSSRKPPPDNPPGRTRKQKPPADAIMVPANRRARSLSEEKNYKKSKPRRARAASQVVTGSSQASQSGVVADSTSYKKK